MWKIRQSGVGIRCKRALLKTWFGDFGPGTDDCHLSQVRVFESLISGFPSWKLVFRESKMFAPRVKPETKVRTPLWRAIMKISVLVQYEYNLRALVLFKKETHKMTNLKFLPEWFKFVVVILSKCSRRPSRVHNHSVAPLWRAENDRANP